MDSPVPRMMAWSRPFATGSKQAQTNENRNRAAGSIVRNTQSVLEFNWTQIPGEAA